MARTEDDGRLTLTAADVERVVSEQFGLTVAEQKRLGGEVDVNIWVRVEDGREFLLKGSPGEVDADVTWQQTVLEHLDKADAGIPVPRVVQSRTGSGLVTVQVSGRPVIVRLLTWLPGTMFSDLDEVPRGLLVELGRVAARLTQALASLPADTVPQSHHWDVRRSNEAVEEALPFVEDEEDRRAVERLMNSFERVRPLFGLLPMGVVHHDLNDFNVLAAAGGDGELAISGVLDVNDSLFTIRVAELAVAVAYAMLRRDDPLDAAAAVVGGFHSTAPLSAQEISVIFPLAAARLCVNATTWTRRTVESHNDYGRERMRHTWPTLRKLATISPLAAEERLRGVCEPDGRTSATERNVTMTHEPGAAVFNGATELLELDLSPASDFYDDLDWTEPKAVAHRVNAVLGDRSALRGFTRHLTPLLLLAEEPRPGAEAAATVQLGATVLAAAGEAVQAPLDGRVIRADRAGPLVLEHSGRGDGQDRFWTSWRGLDSDLGADSTVRQGTPLGTVDAPNEDRGLGPTVNVQLLLSETLADCPPPVRVRADEVDHWSRLTADPGPLLALPEGTPPPETWHGDRVIAVRDRRLARSQRAYYRRPPNLVRGRGVWLYDEYGRAYLDAINNVTHVGHAEPRVAAAAARQMRKLNTNSRFIYPGIASYAERLVSTLPAPLEVVFLVCTGSEANDLALRMARQVTGRQDVLVIDGAYHGNTTAVMGVSPNRYKGPGGRGAPPTTHEVVRPDVYRGDYGRGDPQAGAKYAADVAAVVDRLVAEGRPPAAFIAESLMGTAGNIVFPEGYLEAGFAATRREGGLCISDEVQVGVGRLGTHFWGFQAQGVVPDIVTMGKPLGNGHPIAAVVTTREIADAFDDGVKYFNTFGGNPVSCAVGTAVLDIVQGDGLQAHAREVGQYFLDSLQELRTRHELIGDVRGHGLYLGIELVRDTDTKEPAAAEALALSELMKDQGVIVYPTGAFDNVLKLKPPMVFDTQDVDLFVSTLDGVLTKNPRG